MKTSLGVALGTASLLAIGVALAQTENVKNVNDGINWTSGYGGIGVAIAIAIVVAGLVALAMRYKVK